MVCLGGGRDQAAVVSSPHEDRTGTSLLKPWGHRMHPDLPLERSAGLGVRKERLGVLSLIEHTE